MHRFVAPSDLVWYEKTLRRVVGEDMGEEAETLVVPTRYFTDFMRYLDVMWISPFVLSICTLS